MVSRANDIFTLGRFVVANIIIAYYCLGMAYKKFGELDRAIVDFTEALERMANFSGACRMRGDVILVIMINTMLPGFP